jgi:hypothetical protein
MASTGETVSGQAAASPGLRRNAIAGHVCGPGPHHPAVGFPTACGYVPVGLLIAPLVLLQLGFTTASTINREPPGDNSKKPARVAVTVDPSVIAD